MRSRVAMSPQTSREPLHVGLVPLLPPPPDQRAREHRLSPTLLPEAPRKCRIVTLLNWKLSCIGF